MVIRHFFFSPKNSESHHLCVLLSYCSLLSHVSFGCNISSTLQKIWVSIPRRSNLRICLRTLFLRRRLAFFLMSGLFFPLHFLCRRWRGTCWRCFIFWSFRVFLRWRQCRSFVLRRWSRRWVLGRVGEVWVVWWLYHWWVYILFWWNIAFCWRLF